MVQVVLVCEGCCEFILLFGLFSLNGKMNNRNIIFLSFNFIEFFLIDSPAWTEIPPYQAQICSHWTLWIIGSALPVSG